MLLSARGCAALTNKCIFELEAADPHINDAEPGARMAALGILYVILVLILVSEEGSCMKY